MQHILAGRNSASFLSSTTCAETTRFKLWMRVGIWPIWAHLRRLKKLGRKAVHSETFASHQETADREVFTSSVIYALHVLLVNHGITKLPFGILGFLLYDAIYYTRFGKYLEPQKLRLLMRTVLAKRLTDGSSTKKILKELLSDHAGVPTSAGVLRSEFHASFARDAGSLEAGCYITVMEMQRYVRHLLCEDTQSLVRAIRAFADEMGDVEVAPLFNPGMAVEVECQTRFDADASTQTEGGVEKSAHVSEGSLERETQSTSPNLWSHISVAAASLKRGRVVHERAHEEIALLREEEAVLEREAELLRDELVRMGNRVRPDGPAFPEQPR